MLNFNEPIKIVFLFKLAKQLVLNGALVIEIVKILLVKARKTLVA